MDRTYVFISHCVRPGDPEKVRRDKRELIRCLEEHSFGVFDYAERPGNWRDWMDEIRQQFMNCGCVIYFAKKWPEDNPGVVMIELGAALIADKPFFIYRPDKCSGPAFEGYSGGLCAAISAEREIVFSHTEELLPRLRGVHQRRFASGSTANDYLTLTETFFHRRGAPPGSESALRMTQLVLRTLWQHRSALRQLSKDQTLRGVCGLWSVPPARALVTVKRSDAGTTMQPSEYRQGNWRHHQTLSAPLPPEDILRTVYTIGFSATKGCSWLLLSSKENWRFITQGADVLLRVPDKLKASIRRTFIVEHGEPAQLVFFADGMPFAIRPKPGEIIDLTPQEAPAESPGDFVGSASSATPARLAHIHGLHEAQALLAGGRAEGFPTVEGENAPGLWFHEDMVQLGAWKHISSEGLLNCLLVPGQAFGELMNLEDEQRAAGMSAITKEQRPDFDWFEQLLRDVNPEVRDLAGVFYNGQEPAPLLLAHAITQGVIKPEKPQRPGYYRFDVSWSPELRQRLWEVTGHGVLPR